MANIYGSWRECTPKEVNDIICDAIRQRDRAVALLKHIVHLADHGCVSGIPDYVEQSREFLREIEEVTP